jgi:hypothetical protein
MAPDEVRSGLERIGVQGSRYAIKGELEKRLVGSLGINLLVPVSGDGDDLYDEQRNPDG